MFVTCWGNISRDSSWLVSVFLSPHMFTLYGWYVPAQPSWWHQRSPASLAYTNKYCCISLGVICRNETTVQDQYIQIVEITGVCPLSLPLCTTNYTLQAPSSEGSVVGWWSPHPLRAHQGRRGVRGYLSHQMRNGSQIFAVKML